MEVEEEEEEELDTRLPGAGERLNNDRGGRDGWMEGGSEVWMDERMDGQMTVG